MEVCEVRTTCASALATLALAALFSPPAAEATVPVRSKVMTCAHAELGAVSFFDRDTLAQETALDPLAVQSHAALQSGESVVYATTSVGASWESGSSGNLRMESILHMDNWVQGGGGVSGAIQSCPFSGLTYVFETEGDAELVGACEGENFGVNLFSGDTTFYQAPQYQVHVDDELLPGWTDCSGEHHWQIEGAGEHTIRIGLITAGNSTFGIGYLHHVKSWDLSWQILSQATGIPTARQERASWGRIKTLYR